MESEPSPQPLAQAVDGFLTALRAGKPSPHTITAYSADLRHITGLLGSDPSALTVADLTVERLVGAFAGYADTHSKASTARAWSTWNRFADHLAARRVIAGSPMRAVPKPKVPKGAPRAFTDSDIAALVDTLAHGRVPARYPWPIRDYALIATLAATGLRRGELLALNLDDIEGRAGQKVIAVRHGKGDKYRAIPLDPRLDQLLTTYLHDRWIRHPKPGRPHPGDPWSAPAGTRIWVGDKGQPLTSSQLSRIVERAYRAAGINSHRPPGALAHALRHTFATTLIENGATAIEVMDLLGHASLQTTQRYLATRPHQLRAAIGINPVYTQIDTGARPG